MDGSGNTQRLDVAGRSVPLRTVVRTNARRLRLAVVPGQGFRLTCPRGVRQRAVADFLTTCQPWMASVVELAWGQTWALPPTLEFRSVGESWALATVSRAGQQPRLRINSGGRLLLAGDLDHRPAVADCLLRFVRRRAAELLPPRLEALAQATGLHPKRVVVRASRSRWGSCSVQGTVALSAFLLFVPPPALDYVLLHELCHLRRADHSPAFWAMLAQYDADHVLHRRLLGHMADHLPACLL